MVYDKRNKRIKKGGDDINQKVIYIEKYKNMKSKNDEDTTENILDMLGINYKKENLFYELRKQKRKENGLNGIEK